MPPTARRKSQTAKNQDPPTNPVTQLELVELLHKRAVNELVIVEVEPTRYQVHPIVAWRLGRSVLLGSGGQPRTFRSLDTLATHLKTLGTGHTVVRMELLG